MSKELARKTATEVMSESTPTSSVDELIGRAITAQTPVETMEKLLAMRRELKAEWAKERFDEAMSKFQAAIPEIKRTKSVPTRSGTVAYSYAPIEQVVKQLRPLLSEHGFSYNIKTEVSEGKVKSICTVKHIAGHQESSEMEVPLGNKTEVMSQSQVVAAASTFSKRYAFQNAFGIMTGESDDEALLKEGEIDVDMLEEAKGVLGACKSVAELTSTWKLLRKEVKASKDVIIFASEMKRKLS